jgi:hypothetical protein
MVNVKTAAKDPVIESIRDLLSLKITLPLGNPDLKLVHTNQFCQTELPDEFVLDNFGVIAKALNSTYNRNVGYTVNKWYIEGRTVTNDGDKFTMELELNPFASTLNKYSENRNNYLKAYTDALEKQEKAEEKEKKNNVPSVTGNTSFKGGEGTAIDNQVKKIIGKETDPLRKAKLIHEWLRKNLTYSSYECSHHSSAASCLKSKHLNCADTSRLTRAMMSSAGLDAKVVHHYHPTKGHFWTMITINGKKYFSDATSKSRKFNQVWKYKTYVVRGKNPSC